MNIGRLTFLSHQKKSDDKLICFNNFFCFLYSQTVLLLYYCLFLILVSFAGNWGRVKAYRGRLPLKSNRADISGSDWRWHLWSSFPPSGSLGLRHIRFLQSRSPLGYVTKASRERKTTFITDDGVHWYRFNIGDRVFLSTIWIERICNWKSGVVAE